MFGFNFTPIILKKYYPDPFVISKKRWNILLQFFELDLSKTNTILAELYSLRGPLARVPSDMFRSYLLSIKLGFTSITDWVTALKEWHLYAIISGSRHDMLSFLHSFFTMKTWLPEFNVAKILLDLAHDADAVYRYCNDNGIRHPIDFNIGNTGNRIYKDTFTLDENGVSICQKGLKMHSHGIDYNRKRHKYSCPIADNSGVCDTPCSDSAYGRVVFTRPKDDPRTFTIPARGSNQWKEEYNARTSVERSNKREKEDYKLEGGKHRSSKMWYCRLYAIMSLIIN
jgi:hypothetical protein